MLLNLQSNALKFTDQGGSVTVFYSLYKKGDKSYVELQVRDTGQGIKKEDQKKLFKLFGFVTTTQERNTRGIGLGLVISKQICEAFGGQIGFDSEWEKGSTFGYRIELGSSLKNDEIEMKSKAVEVQQKKVDVSDEVADDLELLVFGGNAELPTNVLDHLPAIGVQKTKMFEFEILDDQVDDENKVARINDGPYPDTKTLIDIARVLLVDDEPYNIDALKIVV